MDLFNILLFGIAVREEAHFLRPMLQKECVERKRNGKNEEGENKKGKLPSSERDQILDKRDQDKNSETNSYSGKTIGGPPFSFEPMSKDHGEWGDAEASHSYSNADTEKEIKLEERLNLCTEEKP